MTSKPRLSIRVDAANPNHHLWLNNGTWFLHLTVHPDALTKQRIRRSLRTRCLMQARRRRDRFIAWLSASSEVRS